MTPESRLKRQIKTYLEEKGVYWTAIKGGAFSKTGDPDLIACYQGRFVAIEAKTDTGVQSEWQKLREHQITASKGIYILARSVSDVSSILDMMAHGNA